MDEACDMVALPWVLRKAIAVLNYLEVSWRVAAGCGAHAGAAALGPTSCGCPPEHPPAPPLGLAA